jgi:PAS domain S-box-containing protein
MSDYPYYDNMTRTGKTNGKDRILQALPKLAALLLRADDVDEAMNKALALLGRTVDVSRVYIFSNRENLEGQLLTSQRWEWVQKGITAQIKNPGLQNLSFEEAGFGRWVKLLSAGKAVFGPVGGFPESERDLLKAQDILSLAVVPIFTADIWWGFIGFDDCSSSREWSKSEIDVLLTAAELIGAALERLHVERQLRYWSEFNRNIVESTSVGVLVVDKNARIQVWNGGMEEQFEVDAAEVLGEDIFRVFPVLAEEELGRILRHCIEEEEGFSENRLTHQTRHKGERILDVKVTPLRDIDEQFNGLVVIISDATAQHEVEQALAESEGMYRALTESALMGVYIYREGRFLFVNERMAKITGYSVKELVEISTGDIVAPDDRERLAKKVELIKSGKDKSSHYTFKIARKDGSEGYMEVYTRRIMYHGKEASIGHCLDISHRLKAQEALRASEERYRSTIQSMGDMIHVLDRDMRIVMYNQPFKQWTAELGLELGEVSGKALFEVFPFLPEKVKQEYDEVWRTGKPLITIETTALTGQSIITETRKIPVTDKEGNVERIVTVVRDITGRKRAEEALAESEEKFRGLAESAKDIIVSIDFEGTVLYINPAVEDILGYKPKEIIGLKLTESEESTAEIRKIYHGLLQVINKESHLSLFEIGLKDKTGRPLVLEISARKMSNFIMAIARDVTERKRTSEALLASEERYRTLQKNIPVGVFRSTPQGEFLSVNRAFADMFGCESVEEMAGILAMDTYAFPEQRLEFLKRMDEEGTVADFEVQLKRKDGSVFWASLNATTVFDEKDKPSHYDGIIEDITERKRAEEALLKEKGFSESVIASLPGIFYLFDEKGRLLQWNENFEKISGYSNEEIAKMNVFDFFAGEDRKIMEERIGEVFARGESTAEAEFVTKSGKRIPYFFTGLRTEIDDTVYLVGMGVDITERKQAEEALAESEERLRSVVQTANDVIVSVNSRGEIVSWNQAGEAMFGYSADEILGKSLTVIMPERHRKEHQEAFEQAISAGRFKYVGRVLETVGLKKDSEEFPVEFSMANWRTADELFFTIILRDITKRKLAEEALRASEERYRRLVDYNPAAIAVHCEGKIVYGNKAAIELMGGTDLDEIVGKPVLGFVHPDYREIVLERIRKSQEEGKFAEPIEEKFLRLDGKAIDVEVTSIPTTYQGKPSSQVVFWDITERKRAEQALLDSEERYRRVNESIRDVIFSLSPTGEVLFISGACVSLFGIPAEELIGINLFDAAKQASVSDEEMLEVQKKYTEMVKQKKENIQYELALERNGRLRYLGINERVVYDESGDVANSFGVIRDITESKRAEEEIKRHSQELRTLLEIATEVSASLDEKEVTNLIAERAAELIGADGCTIYRFDSQTKELVPQVTTIQENREKRLSYRIKLKEGITGKAAFERKPILANNVHLADEAIRIPGVKDVPRCLLVAPLVAQGELWGAMTLVRLSQRGFTEHDLELFGIFANQVADAAVNSTLFSLLGESEEKYRSFVEQAIDGIVIIQDGKMVFANRAAARLVGYDLDDLVGMEFSPLVAPECREELADRYRRRMSGEQVPNVYEMKLLARSGQVIDIELNAGVISYGGRPAELAFVRDIRERKHAEQAIRESEERYRSFVEQAVDVITIVQDGKIVFVNQVGVALLGYELEELIGKDFIQFLAPEVRAETVERYRRRIAGKEVSNIYETKLLLGSGQVIDMEVNAGIIHYNGRPADFIIARDIRERKQEQARREVRIGLLDSLRKAKDVEECLQLGCEAVRDAGLFERAVLILQNQKGQIVHLGQVGLDPEVVEGIRKTESPDKAPFHEMLNDEFKTSRSYFIPKEAGIDFTKTGRYIPQEFEADDNPDAWQPGDELFVPVFGKDGSTENYLSVDTPMDGKRPDKSVIIYLEDVIDLVIRQVHGMQNMQALQESEERYRRLFEDSPISLWEEDLSEVKVYLDALKRKGVKDFGKYFDTHPEEVAKWSSLERILDVNKSSLELYGAKSKEELIESVDKILGPESHPALKEELVAIAEGRTVFQIESVNQTLSGKKKHINLRLVVAPGHEKTFSKVLISIADITERKRFEQALQESEEKYRTLFENADDAIFLMKDDRFIDCNSSTLKLYGCARDDIVGQTPYRFSPSSQPDGSSSMESALARIKAALDGNPQRFYWKHIRLDSTPFDAEVSLNRMELGGQILIQAIVRDITARKQFEEALRESEEFNRAVIERSPLGISVRSRTGKLLSANDTWKNIWAIPEEDFFRELNLERSELTFSESDGYLKDWLPQIREVYEEGGYLHVPEAYTINPREGGARWVSHHFYALKDERNRVDRVVILTEDITERKEVEEALRESEEKFRLLSEQSIMGIIIVQDDVFKYINQAAADILEYTTEEMLGWKPQEYAKMVHPDDLEFVMDQIQKKQLGKKEVATNYLWKSLTKSGEVKWLETYSKTTYYQGRTADLLTLVDITERKQAAEALRESEEHYRTLVDTAQEGISLVSPEEKIIFVNPKMVDLLGYSSEELVGRNLLDFIASGDTDFVRQETLRRAKGDTSRYESTIICRDGTSRRVLVNAAPIFDAKGRFSATLGILTDITDLKKVEDELRLRLVYQTAFAQIMNNAIRVGDFDAFVKSCLEILGNALGVSRTFLATNLEIYNDAELSLPDPSSTDSSLPPEERGLQARVSYEWLAPEISSILDVCYSYSDMPDISARLGRDELVASRVSALPDPDARVFAEAGALSVLMAPLHLRNGFYGFIAAHNYLQERQWKQGETQVFHTIVRLISTVIDRYFDEEERRLAEEALAESEQRYRTLVETSSDIIFLLDPAGQPLYISSAVEKMGYEPGEILNRPRVFLEAIRTDELRMLRAVFFKTMQSGNPVHDIDCEIYDRDDRRHWFAVSWNWIKDDKGRVLAVQGVARDISERKQTEKVLRLRMEYEKVLFEISSLFLSEGVSEASEKEFLEKLGRVTEVSRVYLFSHEVEGDRWFMESRHRWVSEQTPELDNDRIGQIYYDEGFERWIECLSTGEDISGLVSELPEGERVIFEADGILSILVLPIFVEGRFWGGIGFDEAKRLRDWDVEDIRLMWTASQIFSSALATEAKASELVLSYEDLRERERRISELNLRLVEAEEDERRRIARTLHDEIAQQLTGVALALSVPELNCDPQIKERLSDTKEMVKEAQKFIRDLSYELRPPALDNLGLAAAVRALARSVAEGAGVSFVIEGEEEFPRADPDTEIMLYRIIQEAVNNAVKHAEADEITVRFEYSAPTLTLSVADDGRGFDVAKVMAESKGVGLRSIHERVVLIGGKIELSSSPNKGTKMRIKVEISLNLDKLEK